MLRAERLAVAARLGACGLVFASSTACGYDLVVFKLLDDSGVTANPNGNALGGGAPDIDVGPVNAVLTSFSATNIAPIIGFDAGVLQAMRATAEGNLGRHVADLTQFFEARVGADGEALAAALLDVDLVEGAYVDSQDVVLPGDITPCGNLDDFRQEQTNLDPAPPGLGVKAAHLLDPLFPLRHRGSGMTIVDVEMCAVMDHEDLMTANATGRLTRLGPMWETQDADGDGSPECPHRTFVPPLPPANQRNQWREAHGTADLGILVADQRTPPTPAPGDLIDNVGIDGIVPQATVKFRTVWPETPTHNGRRRTADAITHAALPVPLGGGANVILLEICGTGGCSIDINGDTTLDKFELVPIEALGTAEIIGRPEYQAILTAVGNGIHVVEAACNGDDNLDEYHDEAPPCASGPWSFRYGALDPDGERIDSGAILVGAGTGNNPPRRWVNLDDPPENPPGGSNYGSRIDAFARGLGVFAPGYGDHGAEQPGQECIVDGALDFKQDWTFNFTATSAATVQVAGCVAILAGDHEDLYGESYRPDAMRVFLRTSGTLAGLPPIPDPPNPSDPVPVQTIAIGRQPNLVDQIDIVRMGPQPAHVFTGFEPAPLGTPLASMNQLNPGAFGRSVCGIGDVNGDGVRDLLIGADSQDLTGLGDAGAVFLFSGLTGNLIRRHDGAVSSGHFGKTIASGRVNVSPTDSVDDYAISSPQAGKVFVFNGLTGAQLFAPIDAGNITIGFGTGLAIGDFDGDGRGDIAVGSPLANSGKGQVKVFSGLDGSLMDTFDGDGLAENLGEIVVAGDLNDDGKADFVAGAPGFSLLRGRIRAFTRASGSFALLTPIDDLQGASQGASSTVPARFGKGLTTFNMDGDGDDEIAVGAPGDDFPGGTDFGVVRVFNGNSAMPIRTINGTVANKRFGERLANAGGFDGDWGLGGGQGQFAFKEDLVVASPGEGKVRVFTLFMGATPAGIYTGQNPGSELGTTVAGSGGWLIMGDPKFDNDRGRAYVFFHPGTWNPEAVP